MRSSAIRSPIEKRGAARPAAVRRGPRPRAGLLCPTCLLLVALALAATGCGTSATRPVLTPPSPSHRETPLTGRAYEKRSLALPNVITTR